MADAPKPLWSANVVKTIGPLGTYLNPGIHVREIVRFDPPGIEFLDDNRLIVYEAEPAGELSSRADRGGSSSYVLHTSVLDVETGKILISKDWPLHPYNQFEWKYSIRVTTGGVLVRTGDILRVCSREFAELREWPLSHSDASEGWLITTSPSRKTVLLNHYTRSQSQFAVVNGETFRVEKSWSDSPAPLELYSISDDQRIALRSANLGFSTSQFGTRDWRSTSLGPDKPCPTQPWFVAADSFVYGCDREFFWATSGGSVLMTDRFRKGEKAVARDPILLLRSPVSVASNGNYVAINVAETRGSVWLDTYYSAPEEVVVYDLMRHRRVLTVEITSQPKGAYGLALSPDGSKLAILEDHFVSEYSIPSD